MPKRVNAHRLAAQAVHLSDSFSAALDGKYEIGLIEATLGHSAFRVKLSSSKERIVSITSAVLRGGKNSSAYAQRGNYLIIDDREVVGVVNTRKDFKALNKAGRICKSLLGDNSASGLEEFFDVEASEEKEEQDIWGKKDEERIAQAAELECRIRRARTGLITKAAVIKIDDNTADVAEPEEAAIVDEIIDGMDLDRSVITSARRLRKMAMQAEAEAKAAAEAEAAIAAEIKAREDALAAMYQAEQEEELRVAALLNRAAPTSWEDEIDIDSI